MVRPMHVQQEPSADLAAVVQRVMTAFPGTRVLAAPGAQRRERERQIRQTTRTK